MSRPLAPSRAESALLRLLVALLAAAAAVMAEPIAARGHGTPGRGGGRTLVPRILAAQARRQAQIGSIHTTRKIESNPTTVVAVQTPVAAGPSQSRSAECRKGPTGSTVPNGMGPAQLGEAVTARSDGGLLTTPSPLIPPRAAGTSASRPARVLEPLGQAPAWVLMRTSRPPA